MSGYQHERQASTSPEPHPRPRVARSPPRTTDLLRLQTTAGNRAVARVVATTPAPTVMRFPGVTDDELLKDKARKFGGGKGKPIWTQQKGYIVNPSRVNVSQLQISKSGRITGAFRNGRFMYVVDARGEVWLGKRLASSAGSLPHPTLIGGKSPTVQAAGMVEIRGGRIVNINNHSGHFKPPRGALSAAIRGFARLPASVFRNLKVESFHIGKAGRELFKPFRSLSLLKLKLKQINWSKMLRGFKPVALKGKFKGWRMGGGPKRLGGHIAVIVATIVLSHFLSEASKNARTKAILRDVDALGPKIRKQLEASLAAKSGDLEHVLLKGGTSIHMNVRLRVGMKVTHSGIANVPSEYYYDTELLDAALTDSAWDTEAVTTKEPFGCSSDHIRWHTVTISEEIPAEDLFGY